MTTKKNVSLEGLWDRYGLEGYRILTINNGSLQITNGRGDIFTVKVDETKSLLERFRVAVQELSEEVTSPIKAEKSKWNG